MKQRLIPFRAVPASWGLNGDAYDIAEAHYYYEGEELARKLAEINHRHDPKQLERELLKIDVRHGNIDAYTYDMKLANLEIGEDPKLLALRLIEVDALHGKITPHEAATRKVLVTKTGKEQMIALLEVDHDFNRLTKHEFEKKRADLLEEPWVAIINSGFDPNEGIDGVFFEFDWNEKWIEFLRLNGYAGHTPEQIVDEWFTDVCRSHSAAELAGSLNPSHHLRG